jgi:hypothetical protein
MADLAMSKVLRILTQTIPDSPKIVSFAYTNLYNIRPIHVKENRPKLTGFSRFTGNSGLTFALTLSALSVSQIIGFLKFCF